MKKEILGLIMAFSALSANAASIDYLNELYADTVYAGFTSPQAQLSEADIAAENETNGYFQEWPDYVVYSTNENGYWE